MCGICITTTVQEGIRIPVKQQIVIPLVVDETPVVATAFYWYKTEYEGK